MLSADATGILVDQVVFVLQHPPALFYYHTYGEEFSMQYYNSLSWD